MSRTFLTKETQSDATTLRIVTEDSWQTGLSKNQICWAERYGFSGKASTSILLPGDEEGIALVGASKSDITEWSLASAATALPEGFYKLEGMSGEESERAALGWALAQYKFDRYLSEKTACPRVLILPSDADMASVEKQHTAIFLGRDLINTPTEHMGPADLQDAVEALAETYGAMCSTIVGEDLLDEGLPIIHAVGRAAAKGREPRLIDLSWGREDAPKVTLVGKGVCFDTGGLDIKPASAMLLMKKDMGGAAHALSLANLIMASGTDVRLRLLIPAVENAIDGNAFRPGDILQTRKGITVEVGNTDAEGRLVLCDALTLASEENPDLLIDFATLTGAARVALGPDLPATYANNENLWAALHEASNNHTDPLWRMPLWAPYDEMLSSDIADISNIAEGPFGGSITAALYLQRFVSENIPWTHFDVFAWAPKPKPGRPKGGEIQAVRATFAAIKQFLSLDL